MVNTTFIIQLLTMTPTFLQLLLLAQFLSSLVSYSLHQRFPFPLRGNTI